MTIDSAKGDVLEIAASEADAVALWLRSGFNSRSALWYFKLRDACHAAEPGGDIGSDKPWLSESDSVWELNKPLGRLKFVYIFSNPDDAHAYRSMRKVGTAISNCLTRLSSLGARSVAMIHIPATNRRAIPTSDDDMASARAMISAIQKWQSQKGAPKLRVILADRAGDFAPLLES